MTKKMNKLTNKQFFQLVEWLRPRLEEAEKERWSQARAARIASVALGFPVTDANIRGIASETKEALFPFSWPKTVSARSSNIEDKVRCLVQAVAWMEDNLGCSIPVEGWLELKEWK